MCFLALLGAFQVNHIAKFKAEIESQLRADEEHLVRFRHSLAEAKARLQLKPSEQVLMFQVDLIEGVIERSEAKMAMLRETLERLS
jgi:hypothetical protein